MKRGYTALEYKQKIRKLRAVRPDISMSSDFIVGFPGETERDFEATHEPDRDVGFDQSFSFIYSRRPGTPAASLPDDVTHEEKQQRLEMLQARVNEQARAISRAHGRHRAARAGRASVARSDARQLAGRTENMRWVNFDGPQTLINRFADVVITEAMPNSLRGRLASRRGARLNDPPERARSRVRAGRQRAARELRRARWTRTCATSSSGSACRVRRRGGWVQRLGPAEARWRAPSRCCGACSSCRPAKR